MSNLKVELLQDYYKDKDFVLVGTNSFQGINHNEIIRRRDFIDDMQKMITDNSSPKKIIRLYSSLLGNTRDLDIILKHNITINKLKSMQYDAVISDLYNVVGELSRVTIPFYKLKYRSTKKEKSALVNATISSASEPIILYSGGYQDIVSGIASNPKTIVSEYKRRHKSGNYCYIEEILQDKDFISSVIDGVKNNIENIQSLNDKSMLFLIGSYIPKVLEESDERLLTETLLQYNQGLEYLARLYNASYIDTEKIYKDNKENGIYLSKEGHHSLALSIIDELYDMIICNIQYINTKHDIVDKEDFSAISELVDMELSDHSQSDYSYEKKLSIIENKIREENILKRYIKR